MTQSTRTHRAAPAARRPTRRRPAPAARRPTRRRPAPAARTHAPKRNPDSRRSRPSRGSLAPFVLLSVVVVSLCLLGLTMVLSASSVTSLTETGSPWGEFRSQSMWLGLGLFAMAVGAFTPYRLLRRFTLPGLAASFLLLVGVLVPGLGVAWQGAQRWIRLGPVQFQPSEIAKFALVLYAAHVLSRDDAALDLRRSVKPLLVVLSVLGGLILLQPNLGTTIIFFAIGLTILYASGVRLWVLGALGAVSLFGATLLAYFAEYRRARLLAFLDPWADPLDEGWQTIQSLVSVANGGVTGVGIGASRGKFGFLPEAHNDFVFAVTAEEFGLVGASVVVAGFVVFGLTGLVIARRADRYGALLVIGVTAWILVQAFINMGAVLGLLPITGVPLPFLSAGGTSLVATLGGVGVMLSVARSNR